MLEFFDEFVRKECRKLEKLQPSAIITDFIKKKNLIQDEAELLKKNMRRQVFAIEKESRIELFIQQHQAHIIRLANTVAREIGENPELDLGSISSARTKLYLYKTLLYTSKIYSPTSKHIFPGTSISTKLFQIRTSGYLQKNLRRSA